MLIVLFLACAHNMLIGSGAGLLGHVSGVLTPTPKPMHQTCCSWRAHRTFQFGPGAVLGCSDMFLECPARFRAVAAARCRMLRLSQAGLHRLTAERPKARSEPVILDKRVGP